MSSVINLHVTGKMIGPSMEPNTIILLRGLSIKLPSKYLFYTLILVHLSPVFRCVPLCNGDHTDSHLSKRREYMTMESRALNGMCKIWKDGSAAISKYSS